MATIWVSQSGNDSTGDGSEGTPYKTIEKGFTEASAGDTIKVVASSTAYAVATDTIPSNITLQGTTFASRIGVDHAILDCSGSDPVWTLTDYFTMEDIIFKDWVASSTADSWINTKSTTSSIDATITFNRVRFEEIGTSASTGVRGGFIGGHTSLSSPNYDKITVTLNRCELVNCYDETNSSGSAFFRGYSTDEFYANNLTFYADNTATYGFAYMVSGGNSTTPINIVQYKNVAILNEHADTLDMGLGTTESTDGIYYSGNITLTANVTNSVNSSPQFIDKANGIFYLGQDDPAQTGGVAV